MQNEMVLARFKQLQLTPTGKREISSLSEVDNGFVSNLLSAINELHFQNPRRQDLAMVEYLKRSDKDKHSIGHYQDVKALLNALASSNHGLQDKQKSAPVNRQALPLLNIGREISYSFYVGEMERDELDYGELFEEEDGPIIAIVSKVPVQLTYKVWALAADLETLGHMTGAIGTWMRLWQSQGATSYECTTSLCGMPIAIDNVIDAPKEVTWTDISPDAATERVYAAEILITVVSAQLVAHMVEATAVRHEVALGFDNGR